MKKLASKVLSLGLCAVLAVGGVSSAMGAAASGSGSGTVTEPAPAPLTAKIAGTSAPVRDETVYVLAGADGQVERIIVSDWLKNTAGSAGLTDSALLTDVENVKGNEGFTLQSGGRVWDAQGQDIYCQGGTDQPLPVDMAVSCTLDGQPVTPDQLAGKSGRVTIRFDYTNRQYEMVEIDGRQEKIYVPFAMLTGVLLDSERFSNVSVSSGRVYSDGDRIAVVGLALPGLQENLDIEEEKLELPGYVEITADAEDFRLETTFTLAVSDPFSQLDTDALDSEDLDGSLEDLSKAMKQLTDGSSQLYSGLCALLDSSTELAGGVEQLTGGADALAGGAAALKTGAEQLQAGADSLGEGLQALTDSSDTLSGGAGQVFDSLLASAGSQLASAGVQAPALTRENYGQILDGVLAQLGDSPAAAQVAGLKTSLDSYGAFYQGLLKYTAGVDQAASGAVGLRAGAGELARGAGDLSGGAAQLQGGLRQLQGSLPALTDGVTRLRDGAKALSDGLEEFDKEGVQKLIDAVDGDLEGLFQRIRATADAARGYRSFSCAEPGEDDQVKFIYRAAAIQAAE